MFYTDVIILIYEIINIRHVTFLNDVHDFFVVINVKSE